MVGDVIAALGVGSHPTRLLVASDVDSHTVHLLVARWTEAAWDPRDHGGNPARFGAAHG
jgi:hypothetical protein